MVQEAPFYYLLIAARAGSWGGRRARTWAFYYLLIAARTLGSSRPSRSRGPFYYLLIAALLGQIPRLAAQVTFYYLLIAANLYVAEGGHGLLAVPFLLSLDCCSDAVAVVLREQWCRVPFYYLLIAAVAKRLH